MNQAADQPMPPEPGSATIRADRAKRADTTFADTTSVDTGSLLELAVFLARQAGTTIVEMRDEAITSATTKSSPTDPVTAADSAAEKIIVN
ncbi:MAG: hypothetical protein OER95_10320, partial [Acidimicrobiia bacterium]|nr:hypothetical protein [Acidimicrobiia bacterium]